METGPWPHLDRRQERGVVWGGTSPLPLRGACELRRTPLSGSSWNSPSTSFWVNKGNKRGDKAALTRPLRHHLLGLYLKETNLIPLHADYRVPPASADSLRSRLAASSEARMASSLSQKVMPRVLPLWRSPRAIMPLKPSISLPWGKTTSRAWRSPSSMSSGGTLQGTHPRVHSMPPLWLAFLKACQPFLHMHDATDHNRERTSENAFST